MVIIFEELFNIANKQLAFLDEKAAGLPESQVTVLVTEKNIYLAVNDINGLICNELKNNEDTKILRMLTMWKNGSVDISSFDFRKALVDMDNDNNNTDIILQGEDGNLIKKLAVTLP